MFNEKLLLAIPYTKLRKTLAILLYVLFMIWIIYSHNKTTNENPTTGKKTVVVY